MWGHVILWIALIICLITDLRERRILNVIVFPLMAYGLVFNFATGGWKGLIFGLEGLILGLVLFFVPFALGGLGAGDVKLLAAIGSVGGPVFVFYAALGTAITGGMVALVILLKQKRFLNAIKRIGLSLTSFIGSKNLGSLNTLEKAAYSESFPYGLAIIIGTFGAYAFI